MSETKSRILIVDDDRSIRITLSYLFTEIGYGVRTAEDGFSALAEMREEIPNILLTDLNMPGMSGFELLSVVRHRFPAIQTVAMSGAFCGNEVPSGVAADKFYQKGSSIDALLRIIEALPRMERRASSHPHRAAAIPWIHRSGEDSYGRAPVAIACPECLRPSILAFDGAGSPMPVVECAHCGSSIQWAIAEASEQITPQSFQQNSRWANLAQNLSATSN